MVESGEEAWSSEGGEKREQESLGYLVRLQEEVCFVCVCNTRRTLAPSVFVSMGASFG